MGIKHHKPEEIVSKLRQVELLEGTSLATDTRFVVDSYDLAHTATLELSEAVYNALIGFIEGEFRFLSDDLISTTKATLATCIVTGRAMF